MSAQTIFSALDYLNRWARAKAYRLAPKTQLVTSKHRNSPSVSGTCISLAVFEKKKKFSEERDFISFSLGFSLICQEKCFMSHVIARVRIFPKRNVVTGNELYFLKLSGTQ